jgi:tellurite resistance protein
MYLHGLDALAQPQKNPAVFCWQQWGKMRDAYEEMKKAFDSTEADWKGAMEELKKCRKNLEAAQVALKAARRRTRSTR